MFNNLKYTLESINEPGKESLNSTTKKQGTRVDSKGKTPGNLIEFSDFKDKNVAGWQSAEYGLNDDEVTPYSIKNLTEADILIYKQVSKGDYDRYQMKKQSKMAAKAHSNQTDRNEAQLSAYASRNTKN